MKYTICALSILLMGSHIAADDTKTEERKDQEKIQGVWKVVSSEKNGKPHEDTKDAKFVFKGEMLTVQLVDEKPKQPGAFELDPSKKPKWINSDLGRGIYILDGDTLKICSAEERPTKFVSKRNVYLYILKRDKP